MPGGRRVGAALALFILTTLGCVAPQSFPWKADEPFPYGLTLALEHEDWGREEVTRRLGSPDAIRESGRIAIWVEPRQMELDFMGGVHAVENHHLLIEYDEQWRIAHHQIVVNSGCMPSGECLANVLSPPGGPFRYHKPHLASADITEWKGLTIDHLVLYAAPADDLRAKQLEVPPDRCRLFVFVANDDLERFAGPYVKLGHGPASHEVAIPPSGFLMWDTEPDIEALRIVWSDYWGNFDTRRSVEVSCDAGAPVFFEIELIQDEGWSYDYHIEARILDRGRGESAIEDRSLVLE